MHLAPAGWGRVSVSGEIESAEGRVTAGTLTGGGPIRGTSLGGERASLTLKRYHEV